MKKLSILLFSMLLVSKLYAQNWELYRYKQPSHYSYGSNGKTYVELIHQDYISFIKGDNNMYFNFTFKSEDIKCYTQIVASVEDTRDYGIMKGVKMGPYRNQNIFVHQPGYTFDIDSNRFDFILPRTGKEQWNVRIKGTNFYDSLVIKGFGKYVGEVMPGLMDTLVDYKAAFYKAGNRVNITADSIGFQLSKTFGFKKFIHIPWIFSGEVVIFHLAGINLKGKQIGFRPPEFKDYFNYAPGTVTLKSWGNDTYIRDSITKVYKTKDSVVYFSDCQIRTPDNNVIQYLGNRKYVYRKASLGMLQAPSTWPVLSSFYQFPDGSINDSFTNNFTYYDGSPFEIIIDGKDTVVRRSFYYNGLQLDSSYCNRTMVEHIQGGEVRYMSFTTKHGFNGYTIGREGYPQPGKPVEWVWNDDIKVIGFKKPDGKIEGSIEFPPIEINRVSNKLEVNQEIIIFPNPVQELLTIQSLSLLKLLVFNSTGIKVLETSSSTPLDVSALPNGLYLLEVWDMNGNRVVKKFEKR